MIFWTLRFRTIQLKNASRPIHTVSTTRGVLTETCAKRHRWMLLFILKIDMRQRHVLSFGPCFGQSPHTQSKDKHRRMGSGTIVPCLNHYLLPDLVILILI